MPNTSASSSSRNIDSDKRFSAKTRGFIRGGITGSQEKKRDLSMGSTTQSSQAAPPQQTSQLSTQQKLNALENILNQVEASTPADQSNNVTANQPQSQNAVSPAPAKRTAESAQKAAPPAQVSSGRKEASIEGTTSSTFEQSASIQYVEEEKSPELSPEVEKYIKEVKQQQEKAPREIVIADADQDLANQEDYTSEPLIVVPITPEIEKKGKRKPPKFSVRWLVEWSQKIVKMFAGKVVYRQIKG